MNVQPSTLYDALLIRRLYFVAYAYVPSLSRQWTKVLCTLHVIKCDKL